MTAEAGAARGFYVGPRDSSSGVRRASKLLGLWVIAAFLDKIELVGVDIAECLLQAAGPLDLDSFCASRFSHAEINSQVARER
jgi:hypothetical protein